MRQLSFLENGATSYYKKFRPICYKICQTLLQTGENLLQSVNDIIINCRSH